MSGLPQGLSARLSERLTPDLVGQGLSVVTRSALIEETDVRNDGASEVACALPGASECLLFRAEPQGGHRFFQFLRSRKCADGAVLVPIAEGRVAAHIIECKRTLRANKWRDARQQFAGALYRLRTIAHTLDLQIDQVTCYTAWRELDLVAPSPANTVQRRVLRPGQGGDSVDCGDYFAQQADLGPPFGRVAHREIALQIESRGTTDIGRGQIAL